MDKFGPHRYETGGPMLLAGLQQHHAFADAARDIPKQWQQFRLLEPIPGRIGSRFYGVICGHDPEGFEYLCGIEVASFTDLPSKLGRICMPAQYYAVFLHRGHISAIKTTWQRIWHEWLPGSCFQAANSPNFESYADRFDPKSGLGELEIWFPITQENPSKK